MNHKSIVDQLTVLAPQLKAASEPEAVLIKYAKDNNLAPAQLEKFGQVYNIAKTLNFMDKSASRGDSFRVLDMEGMLSKYTSFVPATKAAQNNSEWNSWFDEVENKSANENAAQNDALTFLSKYKKKGNMINILALARNKDYYSDVELEKVASADASPYNGIREEMREVKNISIAIDMNKQAAEDARHEMSSLANELVELHRTCPLPFAEMERDFVLGSETPELAKEACELINNLFIQKGWSLPRYDFNKSATKLVRDTFNVYPIFNKIASSIQEIRQRNADLIELEKKAANPFTSLNPNKIKTPPSTSIKPNKNNSNKDSSNEEKKLPNDNYKGERGRQDTPPKKTNTPKGPDYLNADEIHVRLNGKANNDNGNNQRGTKPADGSANLKSIKDTASGLTDLYRPETYKSKIDQLIKIPSGLKDLVSKKNVKQQKVDTAAKDVGRISTLQRLMLSDPVIGEAEPDTVVSLYNTLAKANPEVVSDPNLLRFALREAIQYEAVPLHTYKDLISMNKDRSSTEELQGRLDDKKYTI